MYWPVVGTDLLEVFRKGLDDSRLAYSQYLAVIKLLYKKGPREETKNWRPISLLNTDYKLLSKVLAERIKSVLPEIIHRDQTGGISGRYIGENIRLIEDILYEMENHDSEAIILMLDMEKTFDRVEWNWLFRVMKRFNFGDRFISWLQTLYSNAKCSILTNGFQSEYFHISRGIRQGDSLSALLFIIQTEPLVQLIRNDDNIEGLTIINNEHSAMIKGCQFVDDMVTVLKNKQYIMPFLEIVDNYGKVSGAKLNINKTLGIVSHSNLIDDNYGIHMTTGPEQMLGVPVGNQVGQTEFWYALIKKLKARLQIWKSRDLTWEGKSYILKSIGIAQVAYATEMKSPPKSFLSEVNNVIDDFIWNGKKWTVKRDICCLPRQMGGLEIPDVFTLSKAKKIL